MIICILPLGKGWGWAVVAQNLVPNPSFEDMVSCPIGLSDLSANQWITPTLGSPDYFNSCNPNSLSVSVPSNGYGYQLAHSGDGYIGLSPYYLFDTTGINDFVEYIQCQLLQPLMSGKEYKVSFYVSLADSISNHAIKSMGAWFSDTAYVNMSNYNTIPATPQVVADYFLTDMDNWMEVSGTFTANGGEEYLTISSFIIPQFNIDTVFIQNSWSPQPASYYYIDDVSVICIDDSINEIIRPDTNNIVIPNIITPNGDGINDIFQLNFHFNNVLVFNRWGQQLFESHGNESFWDGRTTSGQEVPDGTYFYILDTENETYKGFVQVIR